MKNLLRQVVRWKDHIGQHGRHSRDLALYNCTFSAMACEQEATPFPIYVLTKRSKQQLRHGFLRFCVFFRAIPRDLETKTHGGRQAVPKIFEAKQSKSQPEASQVIPAGQTHVELYDLSSRLVAHLKNFQVQWHQSNPWRKPGFSHLFTQNTWSLGGQNMPKLVCFLVFEALGSLLSVS